ncbi:recombination regulator RecX [Fictibacillus iocasae]|uniref:Regulatory protein RecX n=1 Tax=Fictibacillus iocasae TaxID=2715437 RepID=A0ABW2NWA8_9BACL
MAVVTRISAQKKSKERYNVFIDKGAGEEFGFSVHEDVLIAGSLKKGMEISESEWQEILALDEVKRAYSRALHYLSFRMRSAQEIVQYLVKAEFSEEVAKKVVNQLKDQKYVNDREFAGMLVRTRMNTTAKGPGAVKQELMAKGVSERDMQEALQEFSMERQLETCMKLAAKVLSQKKGISLNEKKQKLKMQLLQKGFTADVIERSILSASSEPDEEEEKEALKKQAEKAHRKYSQFSGFEYEMKMKRALFAKGFAAHLIEQVLREGFIGR